MDKLDVAIIGGGMAGLAAAWYLQQAGLKVKVFEAAEEVGGRVRTDLINGYRLDGGFQVFLTAYPECRNLLDYTALDLKPFYPGAKIRYKGNWELLADPTRTKGTFFKTLKAKNATTADKVLLFLYSRQLKRTPLDKIWNRAELPTYKFIRKKGFSDKMLLGFFMPFMGGVFLERALNTSSRFFEFIFKMFAEADIALPANGMGEIPKQLAAKLEAGTVELNSEVVDMDGQMINVNRHGIINASNVLIATDGSGMKKLMNSADNTVYNQVTCLYFAANTAPGDEPILLLNGDNDGHVNNVTVLTNVSPAYSSTGKSLISVSLVRQPETTDLVKWVKDELEGWFGAAVQDWEHIRTYHIPKALPAKEGVTMKQGVKKLRPNVYACGDYLLNASINGAMQSGREAAELIIKEHATAG